MSRYSDAILADAPVAYYRLDDTSGLIAHDLSGNGNDAALTADTTLNQPGALLGDIDASMRFTAPGTLTLPYSLHYWTWSALSLIFWISLVSGWQMVGLTTNNVSAPLLYLNGLPYVGGGDSLVIGSLLDYAGSFIAAGGLDEVSLYKNAVLSPARIVAYYQIGVAELTPVTARGRDGIARAYGRDGIVIGKERH